MRLGICPGLEELSQIEITTVFKESFRTPAAINILTHEDIRRSSATNIPDLLQDTLIEDIERIEIIRSPGGM